MNFFRIVFVGGGLSALVIGALSVVSLERQRVAREASAKPRMSPPLDVEITTSITPKDSTGAMPHRGARFDRRRLETLATGFSSDRDRHR